MKNEYLIKIKVPEFTCLCPKTGQADFATLYISYVPEETLYRIEIPKTLYCKFSTDWHFS